ncbi:MAG: serine/threonine-protein phosphatase [Planctomycetes bacterium]|nr:serine/threonine-protein phosphatase [Planctomycetota bacterium]
MTRPGFARTWFAEHTPVVEELELPVGRGAVVLRASPTRGEGEPCEDAAGVLGWRDGAVAMVVADGVGGIPGGADAARQVVTAVAAAWDGSASDGNELRATTMAAIEGANRALLERPGGAATTVLCALVAGGELRTCHAGDSELLVVGQRGRIKHRTVSHSPVGYAVEAGLLDASEGMVHEDRHLLSNCVGMAGMRVEVASSIRLAPRDTVVLASDGLWDNLRLEEVVELVRKGPLIGAARQLAAACEARMQAAGDDRVGKPDDLSILLYRPS